MKIFRSRLFLLFPFLIFSCDSPYDHSGWDTSKVQIARDEFGVPHIFGQSDPDVAYGLAWAHAEDDFETIQKTDFTLAVLKINQEIAAYFFGFKIEKNIEINRVVINDDFKFFSPGLLLFNEYIKKEIPQLEGIDLTVGDEKYKFDLGGKPHIIYNLKVSI